MPASTNRNHPPVASRAGVRHVVHLQESHAIPADFQPARQGCETNPMANWARYAIDPAGSASYRSSKKCETNPMVIWIKYNVRVRDSHCSSFSQKCGTNPMLKWIAFADCTEVPGRTWAVPERRNEPSVNPGKICRLPGVSPCVSPGWRKNQTKPTLSEWQRHESAAPEETSKRSQPCQNGTRRDSSFRLSPARAGRSNEGWPAPSGETKPTDGRHERSQRGRTRIFGTAGRSSGLSDSQR
jgi:hypothetical protein